MHPCNVASLTGNPAQLRALLAQAAAQTARTGKATLASLVLPAPTSDPLRVFRALLDLYPGKCSYWEQPNRQTALAGAGATLHLQTQGARRFADAALAWQALRDGAIILDTSGAGQDQRVV